MTPRPTVFATVASRVSCIGWARAFGGAGGCRGGWGAGWEWGGGCGGCCVQSQLPHRLRLPAVPESVGVLAASAGRVGHCTAHARWRAWTLGAVLRSIGPKEFSLGRKTPVTVPRGRAEFAESPGVPHVPEQRRRNRFHERAFHG